MDSQSPVVLLLLAAVTAAIVLVVARRARREQAQGKPADEAPAPRSHQPPVSGSGIKVKMVEGGGLWEPWASVPPPRVQPKAQRDYTETAKAETPPDAKGTPSDPKVR